VLVHTHFGVMFSAMAVTVRRRIEPITRIYARNAGLFGGELESCRASAINGEKRCTITTF
jgi:hypothetical protein